MAGWILTAVGACDEMVIEMILHVLAICIIPLGLVRTSVAEGARSSTTRAMEWLLCGSVFLVCMCEYTLCLCSLLSGDVSGESHAEEASLYMNVSGVACLSASLCFFRLVEFAGVRRNLPLLAWLVIDLLAVAPRCAAVLSRGSTIPALPRAAMMASMAARLACLLGLGVVGVCRYRGKEQQDKEGATTSQHNFDSHEDLAESAETGFLDRKEFSLGKAYEDIPFLSQLLFLWQNKTLCASQVRKLFCGDIVVAPCEADPPILLSSFLTLWGRRRTLYLLLLDFSGVSVSMIFCVKLVSDVLVLISFFLVGQMLRPELFSPSGANTAVSRKDVVLHSVSVVGCIALAMFLRSQGRFFLSSEVIKVKTLLSSGVYNALLHHVRVETHLYTSRYQAVQDPDVLARSFGSLTSLLNSLTMLLLCFIGCCHLLGRVAVVVMTLLLLAGVIVGSGLVCFQSSTRRRMKSSQASRRSAWRQHTEGIITLKHFGWEAQFAERVAALQRGEERLLGRLEMFAGTEVLFITSLWVVSYSSLAFAVMVAQEHCKEASHCVSGEKMISSLLLLFCFVRQMCMSYEHAKRVLAARMAYRRLERMLQEDQGSGMQRRLAQSQGSAADTKNHAVVLQHVSVGWRRKTACSPLAHFLDPLERRSEEENESVLSGRETDTSCQADSTRLLPLLTGPRKREEAEDAEEEAFLPVLRNVNLRVERRSQMFVLGDEKSGKTTLLLSLFGQSAVGNGSVHVSRCVAYCSPDPWVVDGVSVKENIVLGRAFDPSRFYAVAKACGLNFHRRDRRVAEKHEELDLYEHQVLRSSTCSEDLCCRVTLARCLLEDAEVLLLDEPLRSLPFGLRLLLLRRVTQSPVVRRATLLFSSRDFRFAELFPSVALLRGGFLTIVSSQEDFRRLVLERQGSRCAVPELAEHSPTCSASCFDRLPAGPPHIPQTCHCQAPHGLVASSSRPGGQSFEALRELGGGGGRAVVCLLLMGCLLGKMGDVMMAESVKFTNSTMVVVGRQRTREGRGRELPVRSEADGTVWPPCADSKVVEAMADLISPFDLPSTFLLLNGLALLAVLIAVLFSYNLSSHVNKSLRRRILLAFTAAKCEVLQTLMQSEGFACLLERSLVWRKHVRCLLLPLLSIVVLLCSFILVAAVLPISTAPLVLTMWVYSKTVSQSSRGVLEVQRLQQDYLMQLADHQWKTLVGAYDLRAAEGSLSSPMAHKFNLLLRVSSSIEFTLAGVRGWRRMRTESLAILQLALVLSAILLDLTRQPSSPPPPAEQEQSPLAEEEQVFHASRHVSFVAISILNSFFAMWIMVDLSGLLARVDELLLSQQDFQLLAELEPEDKLSSSSPTADHPVEALRSILREKLKAFGNRAWWKFWGGRSRGGREQHATDVSYKSLSSPTKNSDLLLEGLELSAGDPHHPEGVKLDVRIPAGHVLLLKSAIFQDGPSLTGMLGGTSGMGRGSMHLGGVDMSKLPLVKLRKLVTVVPRRKFVLSGTVRENIDLLGKAQGDWQLWAALEQCHFADVVRRWPARLDERVCGEEVQVGSRMRKLSRYEQEMVCLVRAMFAADVQESSIMCIDNVEEISDEQTRNLILRRHLMFGMTVIVSCTRSSLIPSDVENLHALLLDDEEPIESETASDDVGSASEEGSDYLSASESDFTAAGTKLRSDELPAAGAKKHRKGTGRMIWSGIKSGIKGGVKTVRKASYLSMQLYEGKSKGGVE